MLENKKDYDIVRRTKSFSRSVIVFCKQIQITMYNKNIIDQLLRSATSIGANYVEADNASSVKDYVNKTNIARKESAETSYWLELLGESGCLQNERTNLQKEAKELNLIFNAIVRKLKK